MDLIHLKNSNSSHNLTAWSTYHDSSREIYSLERHRPVRKVSLDKKNWSKTKLKNNPPITANNTSLKRSFIGYPYSCMNHLTQYAREILNSIEKSIFFIPIFYSSGNQSGCISGDLFHIQFTKIASLHLTTPPLLNWKSHYLSIFWTSISSINAPQI